PYALPTPSALPARLSLPCFFTPLPPEWRAEALAQNAQSLDHEHALAAAVADRPPGASLPGLLPGGLPAYAARELILGRASRLDAFTGYRGPPWLPSFAVLHNWHTSGRSIPVLSY